MDILELLESQLGQNTKLVENVTPTTWSNVTPCKEFDTRALMNHMVLANMFFVAVATGQSMEEPESGVPDVLGDDPATAHRQSVADLVAVLRAPGALERAFDFGFAQMPGSAALAIMLMETVLHGWDLAKATGAETSIDPDVATMLLEGAAAIDGLRSPDGNPFGPAVEVPASATPGDRLVAFAGRTP